MVTSTPDARLEQLALLADPLRRRIVGMLADERLCTCHLVDALGVSQPTVSYHLGLLRQAGWIRAEPVGRYTYYELVPSALAAAGTALDALVERAGHASRRQLPCD